jgi:hypothetical protein
MCLESWRRKKTKLFRKLEEQENQMFLLLQPSKHIWFICSSSLLKTFGLFAPPTF